MLMTALTPVWTDYYLLTCMPLATQGPGVGPTPAHNFLRHTGDVVSVAGSRNFFWGEHEKKKVPIPMYMRVSMYMHLLACQVCFTSWNSNKCTTHWRLFVSLIFLGLVRHLGFYGRNVDHMTRSKWQRPFSVSCVEICSIWRWPVYLDWTEL